MYDSNPYKLIYVQKSSPKSDEDFFLHLLLLMEHLVLITKMNWPKKSIKVNGIGFIRFLLI